MLLQLLLTLIYKYLFKLHSPVLSIFQSTISYTGLSVLKNICLYKIAILLPVGHIRFRKTAQNNLNLHT